MPPLPIAGGLRSLPKRPSHGHSGEEPGARSQIAELKLQIDRLKHKPDSAMDADQKKIAEIKAGIKAVKKDIRQDEHGH